MHRGSLRDVYGRYVSCIEHYQLDSFVRICADSPCISPMLIRYAVNMYKDNPNVDLVSNVCVRTFPPGQSVEVVSGTTFRENVDLDSKDFSREHVTQHFYKQPRSYKILSIKRNNVVDESDWAVDTVNDFHRVAAAMAIGFEPELDKTVTEKWNGD